MKFHPLSKMLLTLVICFVVIHVQADDIPIGQQNIALPKSWKFSIDPNNKGLSSGWQKSSFNDQGWESMKVPDNWDLHNEYANYRGKAWYRTSFYVPALKGRSAILAFGEVGNSYKVFINDSLIAQVLCGDFTQEFDFTSICKQGAQNQLSVEVDNSLSWGAYWNWGGIRRPAMVHLRNSVYIERQEIVSIPDLQKGSASIRTAVYVRNTGKMDKPILIVQHISKSLQAVVSSSKQFIAKAGATTQFVIDQSLTADQVALWHFDRPHLYESKMDLKEAGLVSFQHMDRFGIRKIEMDGYQFKLNGESVRLAGYNWVADDRTTGSTLPEHRYKEDIDMMKEAGANMARLSHRPLPKDVMDYLDEKGILVLAEFNNWPDFMNDRTVEAKEFATKLIRQNFNHPSIFGWSVGNENGNLKENPEVNKYVAAIIPFIKKQLDSSRLVTYVSHTADFQDNDAAQFCDVLMINKYGGYAKAVDNLKARYPGKGVFMSEYGSHTDNLIYDTPDKSVFKSLMVDELANKENLFGYSLWTFNDYRSAYQVPNPATTTPLHQNRQWGIIDNYRNKKRAFRQMQEFYAPVAGIKVSIHSSQQSVSNLTAVIHPRKKMDIPAYILKGYSLQLIAKNDQQQLQLVQKIALPEIAPGADSLVFNIKDLPSNVSWYKMSLVSPTGYAVLDTIVHTKLPPAPKLVDFIKGSNTARIVFERSDFASEYIVKYMTGGIVKSLPATIDHYADLTSLPFGKTCEVWVVGKNALGEGSPSEIKSFQPKAGYDILPPVIWLSEAGDNCFYVAPSFQPSDIQYQLRYGTSLNAITTWKTVTSSSFGMFRVGDLTNGIKYYYQIRKRTGYNATYSVWSEMMEVIPGIREYLKKKSLGNGVEASIAESQTGSLPLRFSPDSTYRMPFIENWQDSSETFVRKGLGKFAQKIKQKNGSLCIAFLGGSITRAHDQYRQQTLNYIQSMNPSLKITGVNAGVSGTGTDLGACRLQDQVLKYKPDLLFVEFAVNGGDFAAMEGIVRQVKMISPSTAICFIYTISGEQHKAYTAGRIPEYIIGLEKIAAHYQLPSIHMGMRAAQLESLGKLVWKSKDDVEGKTVFSKDGVHPTREGGDLYAAAIARGMKKIIGANADYNASMPIAIYGNEWEKATMLDPAQYASLTGQWQKMNTAGNSDLATYAQWFPYILKTETPSSSLCFRFSGTGFGFFDIGGPEVGQVSITVDGVPASLVRSSGSRSWVLNDDPANTGKNTLNRFNEYCFGRYRGQFELMRVKDGVHKVCYVLSNEKIDKSTFVSKTTDEDFRNNPLKYEKQTFYLGKILLLGTALNKQ